MSAAQPPKRRKSARTPEAHFQPEADGFLPSVAGLLNDVPPAGYNFPTSRTPEAHFQLRPASSPERPILFLTR